MEYKKSIIILILTIFLFSIASVCASDVNDTAIASEDTTAIELSQSGEITTTDESQKTIQTNDTEMLTASDEETTVAQNNLDTLSLEEKTYADLSNAVGSGGNINLQPAYYKYNGESDTITITNPGIINGNGAIIDMAGSTIRAFTVNTEGVTINNLTIKNANFNGEGGAIYFSNSGTVENCNFTDNKATGSFSYGGAVYFQNTGTVSNCNFTNNKATYTGGAIYFYDNGNVTNCNFTDNEAYYGGAIRFNGEGNVTNCNFTGNTATRYGGAVYFNGKGEVTNCNFTANTATYDGGAVYFQNTGTVSNCNFTGNNATQNGGAIRMNSGSVENCNFTDNSANYGGAVYFIGTACVTNCNFTGNKATGTNSWGGAVFFNGEGTVENCNFTNNQITGDNSYGGAVFFFKDGAVTNCNFTNNQVTGDNSYGGAVFFFKDGAVTNCNFTNNQVTGDNCCGGAVCFGSNGEVTNCIFTNNQALSGRGGAIYFNQGNSSLTDCVFISNRAGNFSAVHLSSGVGNVSGCLFINNSAEFGVVGQAWDSYVQMRVNNNIFLNNDVTTDVIDFADMGDLNTDYNWFGNTQDNYKEGVPSQTSKIWLFLNATANPNPITVTDSSKIVFKLYAYNTSGSVSNYSSNLLKPVNLTITKTKGDVDKSIVNFDDEIVFYPASAGTGSVTASVENIAYTIKINIKGNPELSVDAQDVYYSNNTLISLNYNSTATGKVNITLKGKKFNYAFTDMALNATLSLGKINPDEYNVTVTYSGDAAFFNATAAGNLTVIPIVDLSVNKTADKDWYYYHDIVVWTITVKNADNGTNATYVNVTDFFPTDKLEFISCTIPDGTSYNNETHFWTIGDMANGTELVLLIYSRAIVTGDIANAVHVDVKETDWNFDNNDDDYTVNGVPLIDVSVKITSDKDEYFIDDIATWTITVHNAANGTNATNANLTEVLPYDFFDLINYTTQDGTYDEDKGWWNFGFMGNGTDAVLVITARARILGTDILYSVSAVASENDWNLDNNDDESLVNIVEPQDIEMTVADKQHYYYHDEVDYSITITNYGAEKYAWELTVSDSLPKGLEFVEVVNVTGADVVKFNQSTLTWVLTNISSETPAVITVRARIAEVDNLTSYATLTRHNGIEKKVGCTIESEPYVDISVVKTSDKDEYFIDDIATWTITVHNAANGTNATGVNLTDVFPVDSFEIISYTTENGTYYKDNGLWNIGFMGNGTEATLTIVSRAKIAEENVINRAIAACNEADWNTLNNVANKTVNVKKPSSSVNVSDITLDYGVSTEVNVTTQGAKGIIAKIDGNDTVVDNYTITIPILDAGIHNLTVTTIPDENYLETTKTVNITINKASTEIILANETLYLKANDVVSDVAKLNPVNAGNLTFVSSNEDIALVYDGTIWARTKGNVTVMVSFAGNDNYEPAENKTITVYITPKDACVSVENETLDLNVDDKYEFNPTVNPSFLAVQYSSSNVSVVTVTDYGLVRAVGEGTAIITLTVGNDQTYAINTTNVTVTVSKVPTEISLTNATVDLYVLDEISSGATLTPADAGNLTYSSGNESVAIVKDGKIIAVGAGKAVITVSFAGDDKYAVAEDKTVTVTVSLKDATVTVNNYTLDLFVGDTFTVVATTSPDSLNVTYIPDDSGVVSVDENGVVTALKEGTGNILVKVGGDGVYTENTTTVAVSVSKVPSEIKIDSPVGEMSAGAMGHVAAELIPSEAGNLSYASNDTSVATVSSTGIIKANKSGIALITVSFAGDDKYAAAENKTITLTVNLNDASVSVNNSTLELLVDDNFTIVATTDPAGLNVTYVPDNSGVYSVDDKGVVTALKNGTGNILVKVGGDGVYTENSTTVAVTVSKIPTKIILQNATIDMKVTDEVNPVVSIMPSGAGELDFTSSDVSVVTVNGIGTITAVGEGSANVTVRFIGNEKYAASESKNITVTVSLNPASVSVNNSTLDLFIDDNFTIVATTAPAGLNVSFVPDNSGVYSVDENGTVTALKNGTGNILVKVGGDGVYAENSTTITVTVSKIPTEISLTNETLDLIYNDVVGDLAMLTPAGAGNLTFVSSDEDVVVVEDGHIIAVGAGKANVTVSFAGGDKYAAAENKTIKVTVTPWDASVNVTKTYYELVIGENDTIVATTVPDGLKVKFTTDDDDIISVDNSGKITAIAEGKALISVSVGDNIVYKYDVAYVNVTVSKIPTEIDANSITATYNVNKNLVITLKDSNGNPLTGENISVELNGAKTYATDNNGQVKVSTRGLTPGVYTAKITFNGTDVFEKSAKEVKVTIKKATPKITAKAKIFKTTAKTKKYTITLKNNIGKPIKNATVYLKVGGKTYKATTNSKGKATFKITKLNKKGTYKATVTYKGNKYYTKATKKDNIKVISTFKTIAKGSKLTNMVKIIQMALKSNGYYLSYNGHYLMVDGIFEIYTEMAVKDFQKDHGLKVTGKVDEKTAKKLKII